jgi:prepilin-type N-terminal cleavage/methylation domain-containing protein
MPKRPSGFTLIELLVVVSILSLLALLGLPSLVRARISANEAVQRTELRSVQQASLHYQYEVGAFPRDLVCLAVYAPCGPLPPGCPCLSVEFIDETLADGRRAGYLRTWVPGQALPVGTDAFCLQAVPETLNVTGTRSFGIDARGRMGAADGAISCCAAGGRLDTSACPLVR